MTRRAIIENGIVTNVIEADPDFELPGKTLVDAGDAGIGWTWDGSTFTSPAPAAPPAPPAPTPPTAADVDTERDRRIADGFMFQSKDYQSRPEDRENISGAALAALAAQIGGAQPGDYRWYGGDSDFVWIAADNSLTPMDAHTMFAFGQAAMAHKQAHIFAARALKDAVPIPAEYEDDGYWP